MTIAVYTRVSNKDQSTSSQKPDIVRWLHAHGHDVDAVRWLSDVETGTHLSRAGFNELSEAIFHGEVKTVIVWKLDRIARTMRDGINTLSLWCDNGVRVVSVTQQLDLSGTVGHIVASVLFGMAEIELQHIKHRQAAGIAVAKQKGVYTGRKKGRTKANPARARELANKGLAPPEIATALGVTERTVFRYIQQ